MQERGPKIPANHMFFISKQDYQDDPGGGPRISADFPSISTLCRLLVTINSCAKGQRGVEEGRLQLSARIQKSSKSYENVFWGKNTFDVYKEKDVETLYLQFQNIIKNNEVFGE